MAFSKAGLQALKYLVFFIPFFFLLQTILILMHEFTHSTVAWLLNAKESPLGIIWGDPIMMTGWDEGVSYKKLFAQGRLQAAAIIGASPLVMHFLLALIGVRLVAEGRFAKQRPVFQVVYWFTVANMMELVAYILMRGFAPNGDTGNFNRGMGLSPWWLFILGGFTLIALVRTLFAKALPRLIETLSTDNYPVRWMILGLSAFIVFLWGSGLRVMFYVYPDPQWFFGLLGLPAFILVLFLFRPSRVQRSE